jgi:hypothetical protein
MESASEIGIDCSATWFSAWIYKSVWFEGRLSSGMLAQKLDASSEESWPTRALYA